MGGEDPLAGWIFPVLWTSGETKGAAAVETAAASLIEYFMDPNALLSIASKAAAEGGADKLQEAEIQRLLIVAYIRTGKLAQAKPIVNALLASYPDSATALRQAGQYYLATRDWADWQMLFQQHLAKHPSDWDLLRDKVYFAEAHGDWGAASQSYRKIMDGGQATGDDFNGYAWNALVAGAVDDDAIRAADRAAAISDSSDFNSLHTLACVYAVQGRTAEARQTLLKAMDSASMVEPNSAVWFAMGLIYEQYGLKDAAIAAYRRVEPPEDRSFPFPFPEDTWVLAQNHLKALHD